MADAPYRRIHVVINPASGKDEPILNTLNDVFREHGVDWDVSITKKYGDASAQAKAALADGADLVVGYGGDGTQHELANAVLEAADALGTPGAHRHPARRHRQRLRAGDGRAGDAARGDRGALPEHAGCARSTSAGCSRSGMSTSRTGTSSSGCTWASSRRSRRAASSRTATACSRMRSTWPSEGRPRRSPTGPRSTASVTEFQASRVYVVNSGMMGTGLRITHGYSVEDGLLDAFAIDGHTRDTMVAAASRFLDLHTASASRYHRQCRTLRIETTPDQPVWTDGEYIGRTPLSIEVAPAALSVVVP